ncbi:hypothetical protein STEG23_034408 [Scotinomys teguina]
MEGQKDKCDMEPEQTLERYKQKDGSYFRIHSVNLCLFVDIFLFNACVVNLCELNIVDGYFKDCFRTQNNQLKNGTTHNGLDPPRKITKLENDLQHQSPSEKLIGIKETPYGVYFVCGKSKSLGKKVLLPQLLTVYCPNGTSRTQKKELLNFSRQGLNLIRPHITQRLRHECERGSINGKGYEDGYAVVPDAGYLPVPKTLEHRFESCT